MNIAIIGHGHVGGALAKGWAAKGHAVWIGVREQPNPKAEALLTAVPGLKVTDIASAAAHADVVVIAAVPAAVHDIADAIRPHVKGKVVIETMNSVSMKPQDFHDTYTALRTLLPDADVVKGFNSTGFENMANPHYSADLAADMFMAGGSAKAKEVMKQLALELGFANCYDFGGEAQVPLLEQFALAWINLAFKQGLGRDFMLKLHFRPKGH